MNRLIKMLMLASLVIGALSAVSVAGASAASFHASGKGTLTGSNTTNQVFTAAGGEVTCTEASIHGQVTETEAEQQEVTVEYEDCAAFGLVVSDITTATYDLHASGQVDVTNTITITIPGIFGCQIRVEPQSLGSVSYTNVSGSITQHSNVTNIVYTVFNKGALSLCGSSGSNGTYDGSNSVHLEGGTVEWVA